MPTIDNYKSESYIRLLLQGESGAGKTTTSLQFPGVWVFDCDLNLRGPLQWLRENNKPLPIGYDTIDRKEDGSVVPENQRWDRIKTLVTTVGQRQGDHANIQTFVFDSMSKMNDYNKAHVLRTNPTKSGVFEQTSWGFFYSNWVGLVGAVTSAKIHCVFNGHDKIDKDELDGSTKIMLNVQGQFQAVANSLFTDAWHAEVVNTGGLNPVYKRVLRTIQDYKHAGLKNSFGLPPVFEFDWKLIEAKLKGEVK
jgi:hypothetical protein